MLKSNSVLRQSGILLQPDLVWLTILLLVGFGIHAAGIGTPYYMDDYGRVVYPIPDNPFHFFFNKFGGAFYRPIEYCFLATMQKYFGLNTVPIHIVQISLHGMLSWFVFLATRAWGFSRLQAYFASLYMLVCQANTVAVLSNDTMSQVSGTFFGFLAIWLLDRSTQTSETTQPAQPSFLKIFDRSQYLAAVLAFALSIFSKESSVAYLPILAGLILVRMMDWSQPKVSLALVRRWTIAIVPFFSSIILYLVMRLFIIGAPVPGLSANMNDNLPDDYKYGFGLNIIKNIALFLFAGVTPISSTAGFLAFQQRGLGLVGIVLATAGVGAIVLYGLWRTQPRPIVGLVAAATFMGFFPMVLMGQVSEHQLYNSLPFFAILIGIGLGKVFQLLAIGQGYGRGVAIALLALLFASHTVAIHGKAEMMKQNGDRADYLLSQLVPYLQSAPAHAKFWLVNAPTEQREFSVLILNDFNVLRIFGQSGMMQRVVNRRDLSVEPIDHQDLLTHPPTPDIQLLHLENGKIQPYRPVFEVLK
jgi:hypothetical protein